MKMSREATVLHNMIRDGRGDEVRLAIAHGLDELANIEKYGGYNAVDVAQTRKEYGILIDALRLGIPD